MMVTRTAALLSCLIFFSCSRETRENRNIYHFTACSSVSTAIVFQVPRDQLQKQRETSIMLRGEMWNNSRLLIRKDERDYLSLPLKKGNIDTTFNIPNEGEALSFYFLTDSPGSLELAGNIPLVESLFDIKETGSDRIGSLELILRR